MEILVTPDRPSTLPELTAALDTPSVKAFGPLTARDQRLGNAGRARTASPAPWPPRIPVAAAYSSTVSRSTARCVSALGSRRLAELEMHRHGPGLLPLPTRVDRTIAGRSAARRRCPVCGSRRSGYRRTAAAARPPVPGARPRFPAHRQRWVRLAFGACHGTW